MSEPQDKTGRGFLSAPGWFAAQVRGTAPEPPDEGFLVPPGLAEALADVVKLSAYIEVPNELLDESREYRKPSRRAWLRYRIADLRERLAKRAYRIIAGYDPPESEW